MWMWQIRILFSPPLYQPVSQGDYGNITENGQQRSLCYYYHHLLQLPTIEQRAAHFGSSATLHEALGDLGGLLSFWSELGWLE
ncbi:jg5506 [Pararge aegeria aegeria]|uniref:Jg5506 protein n=1 Tax=Pararge aegeria aegeria TaxID=348720 RepID=A0A8S4SNE0_9NEOP|nr:jg5506 [Pararge aegeria aegeria]